MNITIDEANVNPALTVVGVLTLMPNYCCALQDVLITKTKGHEVYSCQCACGGWCTSGHPTIEGAIKEWKGMNANVLNS